MALSNFEKRCFVAVTKFYSLYWRCPAKYFDCPSSISLENTFGLHWLCFQFSFLFLVTSSVLGSLIAFRDPGLINTLQLNRIHQVFLIAFCSVFSVVSFILFLVFSNNLRMNCFLDNLLFLAMEIKHGKLFRFYDKICPKFALNYSIILQIVIKSEVAGTKQSS